MLLGGLCARLFPLYFAQYLHSVGFFFFLCFKPSPYSCGCGICRMWFFFVEWGETVMETLTWRGNRDCVVFILIFFYTAPFLVLVPRCLWSWWFLCSPCRFLTGITVPLAAVALTVGSWSYPYWTCQTILLGPLLSFGISLHLLWQLFAGWRVWNPRHGCNCICILVQSCNGRCWFPFPMFVTLPILCFQV